MYIYSNVVAGLLFVKTEKRTEKFFIKDKSGREVICPVLKITEEADGFSAMLDASLLSPWSINDPVLYTISDEEETVRFGHMTLSTVQNKMVLLNGSPVYLRGYIRGIVAHEHPNMTGGSDYDAAVKNIKQAKKYGFNLVRFHSTIPSEDFVRAADELGMLVHTEIGFAYDYDEQGKKKNLAMNNEKWGETILKFRNSPSLAIFCIGNEMHNSGHYPEVHRLYEQGKALAPNKLIMDNSGWGEYDRTSADIFCQHIAYFFPYKHHGDMFMTDAPWHINGSSYDEPMKTARETGNASTQIHRYAEPLRPTLSHEAMHYIDIPDYVALNEKFDAFAAKVGEKYLADHGISKPQYLTTLPELIKRKGLEEYMPDYIKASRKWKLMATKMFLEKLRLSKLNGFEMLQFSDCLKYENKNGIVDFFDDDKGIDPAWMRRMNDDLVLLADRENEWYFENESFDVDICISDFLPSPEISGTLAVYFDDEELFCGKKYMLAGGLQTLAKLKITPKATGKARCAVLKAVFSSEDITVENEWEIWLYPAIKQTISPETEISNESLKSYLSSGPEKSDLYVTDTFGENVFDKLSEGKTVVLFYEYMAERNKWQMQSTLERFKPCIWDRGSNLGGVIAHEGLRKALGSEKYFDLNMQPLLEGGYKVNLDHFPCKVKEHVIGVDKPVRDRMKGLIEGIKTFQEDDTLRRFSHLFSFKVGNGNLIVCTFALDKLSDPVVSNFLSYLIDNATNFESELFIEENEFRKWLDETNATGFRPEDVMNYFWQIDNKPVEDTLFWEEAHVDLSKRRR